jgi:hypothetical protein
MTILHQLRALVMPFLGGFTLLGGTIKRHPISSFALYHCTLCSAHRAYHLADQLLPCGSHVCIDPAFVLGQRLLSCHHVAVVRAYLAAQLGQFLGPLTQLALLLTQPLKVALDVR